MNILEKYDDQFAYSSVIFNIAMAIQAFVLWFHPTLADADKIYTTALLIVFEFFMIHSAPFMLFFPKKISLFIFFPFYGLFALAFNALADGNTVLYFYLIIVFNRMRFAFFNGDKNLKSRTGTLSVIALVVWLLGIFIINMIKNYLPVFGLSENFLELSGYRAKHSIGVFTDDPKMAMALAIIYYFFLAIAEYKLLRLFKKHPL